MCELGNKAINQIYEARRGELGARKPQPGDPRYKTSINVNLFQLKTSTAQILNVFNWDTI